MSRPSLRRGGFLAALFAACALACESEVIDLLPPALSADAAAGVGGSQAGGAASAGSETGSQAAAGNAGIGASAGSAGSFGACAGEACTGGQKGDERPHPNCPAGSDCTRCSSNKQCSGARPYCADWLGSVCVECALSEHCERGSRCDFSVGRCAEECDSPSDCHGESGICDMLQGICVECLGHHDCAGDLDPTTHRCTLRRCVECNENSDCAAGGGRPFCGVGFRCTECVFDQQCGSGAHCDLGRGRCEPN